MEGHIRMTRKNQQTINEFLLYTLNLKLANRTWSWDAYGEDVVVLTLWEKHRETLPDETERIEVWSPMLWRKPAKVGRNERRKNIDRLNEGGTTYAILRGGNGSDEREAWDYDGDRLYKLSRVVVDHDGYEYAIVDCSISIDEFLARQAQLKWFSRS
ncbi:hypothetical protein P3T43_007078 [Paraburkholderia sp. GAS41]|uniref:hypothetical protein n=1 Tax=Paraburkholderia sp. GAS41 TaxID=3035134 RepID=UPI003D19867B